MIFIVHTRTVGISFVALGGMLAFRHHARYVPATNNRSIDAYSHLSHMLHFSPIKYLFFLSSLLLPPVHPTTSANRRYLSRKSTPPEDYPCERPESLHSFRFASKRHSEKRNLVAHFRLACCREKERWVARSDTS